MGGDRPGGGEEGGGQKANRDGTGSAGQNQSADEGAGESSEKGAGRSSSNAGQDAKADRKTGQPGTDQQGSGSRERDDDGDGNLPGGKSGVEDDPARSQGKQDNDPFGRDAQRSADTKSTSAEGDESEHQNGEQTANRPGTPTGDGGNTGTNAGSPPAAGGSAPEGDAANLEYARKQTDLVLENLAEQLKRKRVDQKMLDRLGWSEDDLRAFVERWQRRKEAARNANPARRELDEALRSLGLRRGTLRQGPLPQDAERDLHEGYRGPVPAEYQERLRAYNQGISRARQGEGEKVSGCVGE
jgi:hypothetical protein